MRSPTALFIAGGTSGMGRGLARRCADAGSTVIVGGRSAQPADGIEAVAMPLDEYLDEVMDLLKEQPTPREIVVKAAQSLRWAERDGSYAGLLERCSAPLKNLPGR